MPRASRISRGKIMPAGTILVTAAWDREADVHVATSEGVPGLVLEAASLKEMVDKLQLIVPELLELNGNTASILDSGHDCETVLPMVIISSVMSKI
jgi:hypothetical protein